MFQALEDSMQPSVPAAAFFKTISPTPMVADASRLNFGMAERPFSCDHCGSFAKMFHFSLEYLQVEHFLNFWARFFVLILKLCGRLGWDLNFESFSSGSYRLLKTWTTPLAFDGSANWPKELSTVVYLNGTIFYYELTLLLTNKKLWRTGPSSAFQSLSYFLFFILR